MRFHLHNYAMTDPQTIDGNLGAVRELTQWYTTRLEELIRRTPNQYWWLHRRWKDTREPKQKKRQAA
jgi:KDO2-lipid IV(A) lauroyltransferase